MANQYEVKCASPDQAMAVCAIVQERAFQDERRKPRDQQEWSVSDWIIYLSAHLNAASDRVYELDEEGALAHIRKVAALALATMENKGIIFRKAA